MNEDPSMQGQEQGHDGQAPEGAVPVHGRFAPTPSGRMHLGNVWCGLAAWLAARASGGTLTLRIEDLDPRTADPDTASVLIDDLRWLGLDWDEGPVFQSERTEIYARQAGRLIDMGLTYPCYCSRADLHSAQAPHASDGTPIYAGTCKHLTPEERDERMARRGGRPPAVRLMVPAADDPRGTVDFVDQTYGPMRESLSAECGDFIIQRTDGIYAYQLAVVVDDALMGVNQVVRGRDLLGSTARQIYLQRLLGFSTPTCLHLPMLMAPDGSRRLSKRDRDCDLGFMRDHFGTPEVLLGRLAHLVGLRDTDEPTSASELLCGLTVEKLCSTARRGDIPVPGSFFA